MKSPRHESSTDTNFGSDWESCPNAPHRPIRAAFVLILALFLIELPLTALSVPLLANHVGWSEPDGMLAVGLQLMLVRFLGANHVLLLFALVAAKQGGQHFSLAKVTAINVALMFSAALLFALFFAMFTGKGGSEMLSVLTGPVRAMTTVEAGRADSPLALFAPALVSPTILYLLRRLVQGRRAALRE